MATIFRKNHEEPSADEAWPLSLERRRSPRHATLLQIAKFSSRHLEELCILRDISSEGLRAEIYCEASVDDQVRFELRNGEKVSGRVVWSEGSTIGVEFDQELPVAQALALRGCDAKGRRLRPPRLKTDARGTLRLGSDDHRVRLRDVSPAGMRVQFDGVLERGTSCAIRLDGDTFRKASVCWSGGGEVGLVLLPAMSYGDFAGWRRSHPPSTSQRAEPSSSQATRD